MNLRFIGHLLARPVLPIAALVLGITLQSGALGCAARDPQPPIQEPVAPIQEPVASDATSQVQTRGTNTTTSIHLRSINGQYVVAENAGGSDVNANRAEPLGWETFDLIDHSGGLLVGGDWVSLRTNDGVHYVAAVNNGGGAVNAHGTQAGPWEQFKIFKLESGPLGSQFWGGQTQIVSGDKVSFKTQDKLHYLGAEHGGGGVVNAHGPQPLEWETFTLEYASGASGPAYESAVPVDLERVAGRPDLVVDECRFFFQQRACDLTSGGQTDFVRIDTAVRNIGSATAELPGSRYFLGWEESLRVSYFGLDTPSGGLSLAPGQAQTYSSSFCIRRNTPLGEATYDFQADPENLVAERDEGNNDRTCSFTVTEAMLPTKTDLKILGLVAEPAVGTPETLFKSRISVQNASAVDVVANVSCTPRVDEPLIGRLDPNQSVTKVLHLVSPMPPGAHTLTCTLSSYLEDSDPSNNSLSTTFAVRTTLASVTVPGTAGWDAIGHANDVISMAANDSKLFAVSKGSDLWWRDPVGQDVNWQRIGSAKQVIALAANNRKLFVVTKGNNLAWRDPVAQNVSWQQIGHAKDVIALAATEDKLFAVTKENSLWWRDPVGQDVDWQRIGHANNVIAMAASGQKLYAVTRDDSLWVRDAVGQDVDWTRIDGANRAIALAATGGRLFGATKSNALLWR